MRRSSPSSLEFALLGLLVQAPQSGYDLRKAFADTPMRHFSDSPGSIYPALKRLKARHWATAARDPASARKRELFQVTPAGKAALLRWLKEPFGRPQIVRHLDELLLRFAFFDGNLDRRAALNFLACLERELGAYLRDLESYASSSGGAAPITTGALALSFGLERYGALLSWARRAQQTLAKPARRYR